MGPTNHLKVEPEVCDFIRPGYHTKDSANIVEDLGPQCMTFDNSAKGKYVQVWKIAEVHESSKLPVVAPLGQNTGHLGSYHSSSQ